MEPLSVAVSSKEPEARKWYGRVQALSTEDVDQEGMFVEETNTIVVTECCDLMVVDEDIRFPEKLYTRSLIQGKQVRFQVDTGATSDIIRYEELVNTTIMRETSQRLQLYDGTLVTPAGRIALEVQNAKNKKQYQCEFVVVRKAAVSLLGAQTSFKWE